MTVFPPSMFQIYAEYDGEVACYMDCTASFSEALRLFCEARAKGLEPRVVRMDFDVETNKPESISGVTDEFAAADDGIKIAAE